MAPIISLQNVFFTYADENEVLLNISTDVRLHEIFVLFGPSRSGKSSLLRLLNRLSDLQEGARFQGVIQFDGQDIFDRAMDVFDLRRRISMVFAVPTPLPGTIRENLIYGPKMAGIRDQTVLEGRVQRSLQQAALWDEVKGRLDTSAMALSGGQKQRLCLARSLAMEPEVILLDNPTSGLDPLSTGMVEETLRVLKEQYTIIMVPHSVQQAARIADRAGFMLGGELVEIGVASKLFVRPKDKRTEDYITGRFG